MLSSLLAGAAPAAYAASEAQTEDVKNLLEQYHLSKPSDEELNDAAIQGMVDSLDDPYTEYFTDDEWKQFQSYLEQTYVGVGIVTVLDEGTLYVQEVVQGSSAAKAGVQPGDAIVAVDGQSVRGKTQYQINQMIAGKDGTSVILTLSRNGKTHAYTLTRSSVQLPAATSRLLNGGIGYLSLSAFTSDAGEKFDAELGKLENKGMRALILDLRDNGGGYVNQAQKIAENFIQDGVLAHMTDRDGKDNPLEVKGVRKPYPVYVLVNENTASASELLSGALQDYGVAKLIGTQTYGKGVVQQFFNVSSGGVLKVTIEEYYTPNGHKVDHTGLRPDIQVQGAPQQLIAAIRAAGGAPAGLTAGKGVVSIDGIRMASKASVVRKNGAVYIDLKLASSFAGAALRYDPATKTIAFALGGKAERIAVSDSRILVQNGSSSIDVRLLAKWDANLSWSDAGGVLKLTNHR